jgi:glucuronosyltransferase
MDLQSSELNIYDKKLLNTYRFRRNATRLSQLMRDELIPGKETGADWIEHVIRQKGAKHLKILAKDMPIYQRHLIDVIFVLIAVVLASIIFFFSIIWWIISKCRRMHITAPYRQAKNKNK